MWQAITVVTILLGLPAMADDEFPKLPEEAQRLLDNVVESTSRRQFLARASDEQQEKVFEKFQSQFVSLAEQIPGEVQAQIVRLRGERIEANIVEMAIVQATNPRLVQDLLQYYGAAPDFGKVGPAVRRPPPLRDEHATAEHRPAWELLLLAPETRKIRFMRQRGARGTVLEAIARIRNDASITVLVHAFKAGLDSDVAGRNVGLHQLQILLTLNAYSNEKAFHAMMRCLSASGDAAKGKSAVQINGRTLRDWAFRLITDQENYGNGDEWLATLRKLPSGELTEDERQLVKDAVEYLEKRPLSKP